MMLILALGWLVMVMDGLALNDTISTESTGQVKQHLECIRRKLMENNYDYAPLETEDTKETVTQVGINSKYIEKKRTAHAEKHVDIKKSKQSKENANFLSNIKNRNKVVSDKHPENQPENEKNNKENGEIKSNAQVALKHVVPFGEQVYVNENLNLRRAQDFESKGDDEDSLNDDYYKRKYKKAKAKYRLITVGHKNRRFLPRRFIEREDEDGVVIMNVDGGPFPGFELPL